MSDAQGKQGAAKQKAWDSDLVKGYLIEGIPRFILIDQDGMIANANAPRPSSGEVESLINELTTAQAES